MTEDLEDHETEGAWVGDSVSVYDPNYAQSRERVCHHSPSRATILAEGSAYEKEIARLHAEMAAIRGKEVPGKGDAEKLERIERQLDVAVEAWAEWSGRGEDRGEGEGIGVAGYISIGDLISRDLDSGAELDERTREIRKDTLRGLMLFVCQDGVRNWDLTCKNVIAVIQAVAPEILDDEGMTDADLARIWGETRAATNARSRKLERYLESRGVRGASLRPGAKGKETRERNREAAEGNRNRKKGRDRKG